MTTQAPLTSLVITTYNRAALLRSALESVATSEIEDRSQVEVIVVDNNSTDQTHETVEDVIAHGFPFALRYIVETNQGLSYARNRGADEAKGTWVAYMDDDQLLEKHYLSRIAAAFQETRAICVGGPVSYYNQDALPNWLPPLLEVVGQTWYGDEVKILGPTIGKLQGGNMVFNRQELLAIGKYNVDLGRCGGSLLAGEEDDLQERLHAAGKAVVYHPGLIQYHYLDPVRLTKRFWRRHHFGHGRSLYRRKLSNAVASGTPKLFGAPRWFWRQLLARDIPAVIRPLARFDMTEGFYRQLDVWIRLGEIHEARQQSFRKKAR